MNIIYQTLIVFRNGIRYVIDVLTTDTAADLINKFANFNIVLDNTQANIILTNKIQPDGNGNCCNV